MLLQEGHLIHKTFHSQVRKHSCELVVQRNQLSAFENRVTLSIATAQKIV